MKRKLRRRSRRRNPRGDIMWCPQMGYFRLRLPGRRPFLFTKEQAARVGANEGAKQIITEALARPNVVFTFPDPEVEVVKHNPLRRSLRRKRRASRRNPCLPCLLMNPGKRKRGRNPVTPGQAKKIVEGFLRNRGLPYARLTARTVGFSDLARGSKLFVKIHGWKPSPEFKNLEALAHQHGFIVEGGGVY